MNLLNNIYNFDDIELVKLNKKYLLLITLFLVIIISLLIIKKDNYLDNSFTIVDDRLLLVTDKDNLKKVQEANKIIINDIKCDYQIVEIESFDNSYLVSININNQIKNIRGGTYQIYLGKERLFDYIIRIIKK
jgi:hypothetical protein